LVAIAAAVLGAISDSSPFLLRWDLGMLWDRGRLLGIGLCLGVLESDWEKLPIDGAKMLTRANPAGRVCSCKHQKEVRGVAWGCLGDATPMLKSVPLWGRRRI